MKKTLSLLLVLVMVLSLCSVTAFAAENYTGKTVILYTANVRGDVDVYAKPMPATSCRAQLRRTATAVWAFTT